MADGDWPANEGQEGVGGAVPVMGNEPPPNGTAGVAYSLSTSTALWDIDKAEPGTVLFSTGPLMGKPPSGLDASTDRQHWDAVSPHPVDATLQENTDASLVYTTGSSHTGYPMGYPPFNPQFGPSSPPFPSGGHSQGNMYPPSSYAGYRPGIPYSPYTPYQSPPAFNQYPASSPFGHMSGPFPGYSGSPPAAGGYPSSPSASSFQSSPAGGYSPPTGAYGMHFAPYGVASAPPMYAPAIYAHAPYGHPYLPPQGHADENPGMWWFMPASNNQSGAYPAQQQAQAQYIQRVPMPLHSPSGRPHAQSPTALSPAATGSVPPAASPHQMYAAFGAMTLQSSQPATRHPPPALPHNIQPPHSAAPQPPVANQPPSASKGRASVVGKAPGGSRVASPNTTRRPWHPNPPVARSDWVMWVGNVPNDATHDELWAFFNQDTTAPEPVAVLPPHQTRSLLPPLPGTERPDPTKHSHGVSSVFLISRSNCAFVNYDEEAYLTRAVSFFNGRPLRPHDPRCPRLVCRVRRKDDDLRAGVGGQRGTGMHARWVQEQERRMSEAGELDGNVDDPATSPSTYLGPASSSELSPTIPAPVDDAHKLPADLVTRDHAPHHSGTGSTSSSFLARNFPKRYFILKSLTQFDLNISVDRGLWATQPHNESTLDRAFRTSKDVYLIFSANKSGEWFGYARMDGPIIGSHQSVSWESRGPPRSPAHNNNTKSDAGGSVETPVEAGPAGKVLFSPSEHKFAASPGPITPGALFPAMSRIDGQTSAPPELGEAHKQLTNPVQPESLHVWNRDATATPVITRTSEPFELDANAPLRATRDSAPGYLDTTDALERARGLSDGPIQDSVLAVDPDEERGEGWGKPFKIQWIKAERLPFHRTRHLRNPWNSDREVKVSRDGTEVEPNVGQRLLDEWDRVVEPETVTPVAVAVTVAGGGGGGGPVPGNSSVSRHGGHLPPRPNIQQNAPLPTANRGPPGRAR